jgi:hypothetical protein
VVESVQIGAHDVGLRMTEMTKTVTPSRVTGRCKLCLKTRSLCDSHLMPAALFRLLRSKTATPRDPLLITPSVTLTTSRQVSDYLLCVECENKFQAGGEVWILSHCFRGEENFKLRDLVLNAKLLDDGVAGKLYSTKSNPEIDTDAIVFLPPVCSGERPSTPGNS